MILLQKIRSALPTLGVLFFPFVCVVLLGYSLIPYTKPYFKEVIAFGLLSFTLSCFCLLVTHRTIHKLVRIISLFILAALAYIKLTFYHHYGVQISASALYVIFETNGAEASDFLSNYFDTYSIILLCILIGTFILSILMKPMSLRLPTPIRAAAFILSISCLGLVSYKFSEENILIKSISSYKDYQQTKALLKNQLAQKTTSYFKEVTASEEAQTYVFVIGESTSRWHMQLYGYPRETNPLLANMENLITFDSVIAPNVHTILSLDKVLTFSDNSNPNKPENASLIQLANTAGFSTYWISNQRPVGIHESIPTIIGSAAQHIYYTATDDFGDINYDEKILPVLDKVLLDAPKRKIIFIHLIGTHLGYDKRYPENFNHFSGTEYPSSYKHQKAQKFINSYDNAVRYNDHVIHNILQRVRASETKSFVSYFSDHGDEVFDTMDFVGHNEYHGSRPMYEIPFMLWTSRKYAPQHRDIASYSHRRYNLEDFVYTFADLCGISFSTYDATRSIVDSTFIERPRIIKNGVDYDKK